MLRPGTVLDRKSNVVRCGERSNISSSASLLDLFDQKAALVYCCDAPLLMKRSISTWLMSWCRSIVTLVPLTTHGSVSLTLQRHLIQCTVGNWLIMYSSGLPGKLLRFILYHRAEPIRAYSPMTTGYPRFCWNAVLDRLVMKESWLRKKLVDEAKEWMGGSNLGWSILRGTLSGPSVLCFGVPPLSATPLRLIGRPAQSVLGEHFNTSPWL